MYINEVAEKSGESWIINELKKAGREANPGLYRLALKMATGSGKTVVMAMVIAYNTLNKIRYPQDTRFTDAFVIVAPGITIRDRLNVLLPNDPNNYYKNEILFLIMTLNSSSRRRCSLPIIINWSCGRIHVIRSVQS